jgi:hypothetical protein
VSDSNLSGPRIENRKNFQHTIINILALEAISLPGYGTQYNLTKRERFTYYNYFKGIKIFHHFDVFGNNRI